MFSHLCIGTRDFGRALAFYRPLLALLGVAERFCDPDADCAGWQSTPGPRPLLVLSRPFDGEHAPGNGQMVALLAASRAQVDAAHALALSLGGTCEGAPGPRPHYHPNYYGAYFRDTEGNKLCVACHEAPQTTAG
ncbi:VOC family protein [Roseateles sp. DC23W]|uniref:VOC family protein n=1 Tax=Pelomonas dachongensis TaxID=3299029 RepID=A0ABW7EL82_9BURK